MEKEPTKEEVEAAQKEADAQFEALLRTPMTQDEAEIALSDLDVRKMQLMVVRQKWQTQITQTQMNIAALDEKMYELDMERALVFRRTLNKADPSAEAFKNAEVVGE